jgi:hypothetical protein
MPYMRYYMAFVTVAVAAMVGTCTDAVAKSKHRVHRAHRVAPVVSTAAPVVPFAAMSIFCDYSLWSHVYAGDPRRFASPQDRLKIIQGCVSVTGTLKSARAEKDGDFHIRLRLDPQYNSMVNAKNKSGQRGSLVVEPICMNPVKQKDTLSEHVCDGFSQHVYTPDMLRKHVRVTGAYVIDMEHGWNEIHPVTSITIE